jgi:ribonuclease PH
MRPVKITPGFVRSADGSCLIEMGGTRVICTASIVEGVPRWRENSALGWVTAEYGMLPASTSQRKARPEGRPDGRSVEIQRLIGRVLRSVVRLERLGRNTIYLDCDVLEADGGTRTAAVNGAWVALAVAVAKGRAAGRWGAGVLKGGVAAVSVGIVAGQAMLDLNYQEDSTADVDMNVAMTSAGQYVEVQGSSEQEPFGAGELAAMLGLARKGIRQVLRCQRTVVRAAL